MPLGDFPIGLVRASNRRHQGSEPMDRDLVEAARKRDMAAYADLIRIRGDRLFALGHRILRDVERAARLRRNQALEGLTR